jgi:hypothetical protein
MEEMKEKITKRNKLKERFKTVLIIVLIIIIILLLLRGCNGDESKQAVIVEDTTVELKDTSDGNIRVKLNPVVDVENGLLQNLNFSNFNEERLLKIKIKVDDEYIYESDFIKPSEVLEKDYIRDNNIELDGKEAIAEIYSYTIDKEMVGQTNVVIELNDN